MYNSAFYTRKICWCQDVGYFMEYNGGAAVTRRDVRRRQLTFLKKIISSTQANTSTKKATNFLAALILVIGYIQMDEGEFVSEVGF